MRRKGRPRPPRPEPEHPERREPASKSKWKAPPRPSSHIATSRRRPWPPTPTVTTGQPDSRFHHKPRARDRGEKVRISAFDDGNVRASRTLRSPLRRATCGSFRGSSSRFGGASVRRRRAAVVGLRDRAALAVRREARVRGLIAALNRVRLLRAAILALGVLAALRDAHLRRRGRARSRRSGLRRGIGRGRIGGRTGIRGSARDDERRGKEQGTDGEAGVLHGSGGTLGLIRRSPRLDRLTASARSPGAWRPNPRQIHGIIAKLSLAPLPGQI